MPRRISHVLCDLDGVVWLAHEPIPGAVAAIAAIRASGRSVKFVTNNSAATRAEHEGALASIGIEATGDVISSSMAAAFLVEPGERVLVTGGPGVSEALAARGANVVANIGDDLDGSVDAVIVGLHREFDYARLRIAGRAVIDGARLIGTNGDTTFPTTKGLDPGGGSIVAAVASVAGVDAVFAGKPEQPMVDLVSEIVNAESGEMLMVGDRPDTDGQFAERLRCRFALVETGVTPPGFGTHRDIGAVLASLD
ncbi:HAD-IIA family hydrolase [bacterium]|nr:HAD-IIA family hydrolase [bacterium]